jgi:hypothetical protein
VKRFIRLTIIAILSMIPISPLVALEAHVHGLASLQVVVDANTLSINFSSPLDNILGFERKARNQAEVAQVQKMISQFYKANLFVPTNAAQCALKSIHLESIVIKSNSAARHEHAEEGHADLDGEFTFKCNKAENLRDLQVNLFQPFPNMHEISAEIVSARGQTAAKLNPNNTQLAW